MTPLFALETRQRLSRSVLWRLQRRYFDREGIDAWRGAAVPHYVTSNPCLARAYARVILGYLRDLAAVRPGVAGYPALDPTEPITLVELGAGSGRFAFLLLRALLEMHGASSLSHVVFRYVMTDFTETNVAFWRAHDALRPFVERGLLDFAVFDAERDAELHLLQSGETLAPGGLRNPLVVVANYVYDSITQDAFSFEAGGLQECLVSISCPEPDPDLDDPFLFERLTLHYDHVKASLDYYGEPELDGILRAYASTLGETTIFFPSAAIRSTGRLAALADGRCLLLSADNGEIHEEALKGLDDPVIDIHGSFSMPVNYHAMGAYVEQRGGQVLKTPRWHAPLNVVGFLLGAHPEAHPETRLAYQDAIERAGPDDFFTLRRAVASSYEGMELGSLLSLLRMSHHDPRVLSACLPALWSRLDEGSTAMQQDLLSIVKQVGENYYSIGEEPDFTFELGMLLHRLGDPAAALASFERSMRLHGDDPRTLWNMGLCHLTQGAEDAASRCFIAAAAAGFEPAVALLRESDAQQATSPW